MIRFKTFLLFSISACLLMPAFYCRAALPENFIELSDDVQAMLLEAEYFSEQGFSPVSYTHLTLPTTPYV